MPSPALITSTRMYDVAPAARVAWHAVLAEAHRRAGLDVAFIEHGWPTPIGDLWAQPGLCGAFMCGWPYAKALREGLAYTAVASVVPDWPSYDDQARYRSVFLVREDAPWTQLEDALGSRYGWMVRDSQSGWNAPRRRLAALADTRGAPLFSASTGPYGNPRGLLRGLRDSAFDVTAIDAWYVDLLRAHDPAALEGVRGIGYTDWTCNPLLVSGPGVDSSVSTRLADALFSLNGDAPGMALLRQAHVARFVPADPRAYDVLAADEDIARHPEIA
ncbi:MULTISPECIES: phosphate/phosphite/phosphonate ABC transporter substrate-binding protein [unclassified Achromobacter]|uniref:phosphate/phosphite/phosphonate ABC transporter substrate-binding protein n=1 Tax=unclassified Achromobacter TaxID=2626865 RepID=UPI000B5166B8|nr:MULTISPECIES: PhnD/SsuA/transferrin family substrate-binding protein [unclassified Achromobacter]OWT80147.1 ABC transporter substrate-binding protein [Achromobacter sp. HZ34]OWT82030.1 ABC transporter substrate-binding protein [Achromobacter sp. HZ28]